MGRKVKVLNLQVNTYGDYLGIDKRLRNTEEQREEAGAGVFLDYFL